MYGTCLLASVRLRGNGADRLGSDPVERDVLGRIQRVLELEAVSVDRQDRRLAPGYKLRSGAGFAARRLISCGYFPGGLVGPMIALAQALTLPTISTPQWPRSGAIS
jgi:hypothetical protein